jgi:ribosome-associated heat shock protein Hsp15
MSGETEDKDWQRLDRWLWCARFHKTRSLAARFAEQGKVRINRQPTTKPHARLRPGDVLTFGMGPSVRVLRVVALGDRRGPAAEARGLYEDLDPPAQESVARG